ncbi:hypothetical protein [Mycobacterium lepromatosis]|uniref:hypothetical protein n=1 Tax=Mycobacterium lepromatosis TaxID=480418 RepID=UPI000A976102|nr:hypothetical protein [Mycobacterium lepromatosis]
MTATSTEELDLVEVSTVEQPCSDELPVVPAKPESVAIAVEILGGDPEGLVARIPPR